MLSYDLAFLVWPLLKVAAATVVAVWFLVYKTLG